MRFILLYFCILFSQVVFASLECQWPYKTEITINENSGNTLTDHQIQLNFSISDLHPDYNWSNDGNDLRILDSDDNTPIPFYIDSWNTSTESALVWIKLDTLAASSSRTVYLYYGKADAPAIAQAPPVFTEEGIRFHTRNSTVNLSNKQNAFNTFNNAGDTTPGYGCKFVENFTNIRNSTTFTSGSTTNFIAYSQSYFEVQSGETSGDWYFRYGADFGYGGGLYVNDQLVDENWSDDLWWQGNWSNPDVLQGSVSGLTEGYHKIEIIGGEPGNDGGITAQFCKPGGDCSTNSSRWQAFATSNIDIRSYQCPIIEPTVTFGSNSRCAANLQLTHNAPDGWVVNSARPLTLTITNTGPDQTLTNTVLSINLPANLVRESSSGTNWSCTGSTNISCTHNQAVAVNGSYPDLQLNIKATSSTPSTPSFAASVSVQNQYSPDNSNSSTTVSRPVLALSLPEPISCSLSNGVSAGFFRGPADFAFNRDEFRDDFAEANENGSQLLGKTILQVISTTNSNNNPFTAGVDDEYVTIIDGYIRLEQDGNYEFAVNGDDAVEFEIYSFGGTSHIASWYGGHGAQHNPDDPNSQPEGLDISLTPVPGLVPVDINNGFAMGTYRFRFRHQENFGGDSYTLYWKVPGATLFQQIPQNNLFSCTAAQSITISPSLEIIDDPINSNNFKAIPGAEIRYTTTVTNNGNISTDVDSTKLVQIIDQDSEFLVGSLTFIDGIGNQQSGLDLTAANVTVRYFDSSNINPDDGTGLITSPGTGYNPAIRKIQMVIDGTFKPKFDTLEPEFSYQYQVRLQ